MNLAEYIREFLERGGVIKQIPRGITGLENAPLPVHWIESDNVIRVSFQ